uniref:Zinc finger RING-type eukaryotic domain-containing protein n=1 Tax=Monodelphis domestica TaxID=13616 RepID=A0A5F8G398_MONDO
IIEEAVFYCVCKAAPSMLICGHSFCYKCIHQGLENNNKYSKCNYVVDNIGNFYHNFLRNELVLKLKQRFEEKGSSWTIQMVTHDKYFKIYWKLIKITLIYPMSA